MTKSWLALSLIIAVAAFPSARAEEHPKEHPTAGGNEHPHEHPSAHKEKRAKKKEHPEGHEHPAGSKAWNKQMRKEFNQAVEDHVRAESKDGAFTVHDDKLDKDWDLKLVGVHKKRIVHLGESSFFACADFKTAGKSNKEMLDLDFYATKGPEGWRIDQTLIHKVNGKPRYTYNSKNEQVPVED